MRALPRPSPFLLHGLVEEWWRVFGEERRLAVVTAWRGDALVGILPALIERRHGLRTARLLGGHESALGDVLLAAGEPAATGPSSTSCAASRSTCSTSSGCRAGAASSRPRAATWP